MKISAEQTKLIDNLILLSLCVLIVALPFSKSIIEIAVSIAIVLWLFKKVFILRSFRFEKTPLNWPILLYLVFVALSMINSQFLMTSLRGFAFKTMEYFLIYFVIVESVKTQRDLKKIVYSILFSCALIGIDGLWQYFIGYDFLRGYPLWSSGNRITASFKFPNGLGGWLVVVMPFCISLAIFNTKEKIWRISGILLSLLLAACLVLNFTKGALLAVAPAIIFLVWKRGDIAKRILLLLLLVALLGIGVTAISSDTPFYIAKGWSVLHRTALTKMCLSMFIDRPFFGHGINTFMSIYENYPRDFAFKAVSYAHNSYLQIAVETGIFGLLTFLWMIAALFISSLKDISRREEATIRVIQIGLTAGLIAYLIHSLVESNLYALQLAVLFYYVLGVAISIQGIKET
jgi:putative inorganic carbon (HCO3(-)) transporter